MLTNFIEWFFGNIELKEKSKAKPKAKPQRQFVTLKQLSALHPGFTLNRLKWLRQDNTQGFNRCVRKVGKRVYVDLVKFEAWVDRQPSGTGV